MCGCGVVCRLRFLCVRLLFVVRCALVCPVCCSLFVVLCSVWVFDVVCLFVFLLFVARGLLFVGCWLLGLWLVVLCCVLFVHCFVLLVVGWLFVVY